MCAVIESVVIRSSAGPVGGGAGGGADWHATDTAMTMAPITLRISRIPFALAVPELFEQARHAANDTRLRRRPSQRARLRAADLLIERQRIGIRPELLVRFGHRHVPHVRLLRHLRGDRVDDVADALVC